MGHYMNLQEDESVSLVKWGLGIVGTVAAGMCIVMSSVALGWCGQANDLAQHKVFDPAYEQVRHDTFTHSQAYVDGVNQHLHQLQVEFVKGDKDQKDAIASIVLHEVASVDVSRLSPDLQMFVSDLRSRQFGR